jgi:hypothetical protein
MIFHAFRGSNSKTQKTIGRKEVKLNTVENDEK